MSSTKKPKYNIPVETVDNWKEMIEYILTTLSFWKKDREWPINLCSDGLEQIRNEMLELQDIPF